MNSFRSHLNLVTGVISIDVKGVRASLQNRGTIVVLNRYAAALCSRGFLNGGTIEVLKWYG